MERCPECSNMLRIGKTFYSVEDDHTPDMPTKVFTNMPMLCVSDSCGLYAGTDLNNPVKVIDTIKHQII